MGSEGRGTGAEGSRQWTSSTCPLVTREASNCLGASVRTGFFSSGRRRGASRPTRVISPVHIPAPSPDPSSVPGSSPGEWCRWRNLLSSRTPLYRHFIRYNHLHMCFQWSPYLYFYRAPSKDHCPSPHAVAVEDSHVLGALGRCSRRVSEVENTDDPYNPVLSPVVTTGSVSLGQQTGRGGGGPVSDHPTLYPLPGVV